VTIIQIERSGPTRRERFAQTDDRGGTGCDDGSGGQAGGVPADGASRGTAALLRAAARGDQTAWNALVDRFASMVWGIACGYRLSPADAAEVSRVTWLGLVDHLDHIEQPDRVDAWLATTAHRESQRALRLAGREDPSDDELGAWSDAS
jgi:hypothetical protein